jgi:hypothetical protein
MSAPATLAPAFETAPSSRDTWFGPGSKTVTEQWIQAHRAAVSPVSRQPVWQRFAELGATWREERGATSSLTDMVLSPSYQRVISLGRAVVPYILAELSRKPDHWFWALTAITGADPVPPEAAGDVRAMTKAWIKWGDEEGLVD